MDPVSWKSEPYTGRTGLTGTGYEAPVRHGQELRFAIELDSGLAMEYPSGSIVRVRGQGLNEIGRPDRARSILGEGWADAIVSATVLRTQRQGVQVRLADGTTVTVRREFIVTEGNARPEEDVDDVPVSDHHELELGSEDEREDHARDDGEQEGSESLKRVPAGLDWRPTFIEVDERARQGFPNTEARMRGLDGVARDSI